MAEANMRLALLGLVPLAIAEMGGLSFKERQALAMEGLPSILEQADRLLFPKKNQKPTGVLAAIARGMAALAYQPGGVTALGLHACTEPHIDCPAEGPATPFGRVCEVGG